MSQQVAFRGVPIELDRVYIVPPLSMRQVRELSPKLDLMKQGSAGAQDHVMDVILAAMQRNYPDMTRQQVAELIDLGTMQTCMAAVMKVSGFTGSTESGEASGMSTSKS